MKRGGQPGNKNAANGTRYHDAMIMALGLAGVDKTTRDKRMAKLKPVEKTLVGLALISVRQGLQQEDLRAINHIADRVDGKPRQQVEVDQTGGFVVNFTPADKKLL